MISQNSNKSQIKELLLAVLEDMDIESFISMVKKKEKDSNKQHFYSSAIYSMFGTILILLENGDHIYQRKDIFEYFRKAVLEGFDIDRKEEPHLRRYAFSILFRCSFDANICEEIFYMVENVLRRTKSEISELIELYLGFALFMQKKNVELAKNAIQEVLGILNSEDTLKEEYIEIYFEILQVIIENKYLQEVFIPFMNDVLKLILKMDGEKGFLHLYTFLKSVSLLVTDSKMLKRKAYKELVERNLKFYQNDNKLSEEYPIDVVLKYGLDNNFQDIAIKILSSVQSEEVLERLIKVILFYKSEAKDSFNLTSEDITTLIANIERIKNADLKINFYIELISILMAESKYQEILRIWESTKSIAIKTRIMILFILEMDVELFHRTFKNKLLNNRQKSNKIDEIILKLIDEFILVFQNVKDEQNKLQELQRIVIESINPICKEINESKMSRDVIFGYTNILLLLDTLHLNKMYNQCINQFMEKVMKSSKDIFQKIHSIEILLLDITPAFVLRQHKRDFVNALAKYMNQFEKEIRNLEKPNDKIIAYIRLAKIVNKLEMRYIFRSLVSEIITISKGISDPFSRSVSFEALIELLINTNTFDEKILEKAIHEVNRPNRKLELLIAITEFAIKRRRYDFAKAFLIRAINKVTELITYKQMALSVIFEDIMSYYYTVGSHNVVDLKPFFQIYRMQPQKNEHYVQVLLKKKDSLLKSILRLVELSKKINLTTELLRIFSEDSFMKHIVSISKVLFFEYVHNDVIFRLLPYIINSTSNGPLRYTYQEIAKFFGYVSNKNRKKLRETDSIYYENLCKIIVNMLATEINDVTTLSKPIIYLLNILSLAVPHSQILRCFFYLQIARALSTQGYKKKKKALRESYAMLFTNQLFKEQIDEFIVSNFILKMNDTILNVFTELESYTTYTLSFDSITSINLFSKFLDLFTTDTEDYIIQTKITSLIDILNVRKKGDLFLDLVTRIFTNFQKSRSIDKATLLGLIDAISQIFVKKDFEIMSLGTVIFFFDVLIFRIGITFFTLEIFKQYLDKESVVEINKYFSDRVKGILDALKDAYIRNKWTSIHPGIIYKHFLELLLFIKGRFLTPLLDLLSTSFWYEMILKLDVINFSATLVLLFNVLDTLGYNEKIALMKIEKSLIEDYITELPKTDSEIKTYLDSVLRIYNKVNVLLTTVQGEGEKDK